MTPPDSSIIPFLALSSSRLFNLDILYAKDSSKWLNYSLEQQRQDLEEHLRLIEGERKVVLETWLTLTPYRNLIPAGTREAERLLYISDLELILEILRNELSA